MFHNRAGSKLGQVQCQERCFDKSSILTLLEKEIRVKLDFFCCFVAIFNCFNLNRV